MVVDTMTTRTLSWEDLVLENKSDGLKVVDESNPLDKDFALQDEDVKKSIANDIPSIDFSKRIHQLLVEEMATSVVVLQLVAAILAAVELSIENGEYNPWMLVEWKSRCQSREPNKFERSEEGEEITGSRFQSLVAPDSKVVNRNFVKEDLSRSKKHGKRVLIYDGGNSRNGVRGLGTGARKDIMGQSFGLINRTQQERHHAIRPSKGQKSVVVLIRLETRR
ncbi:hypothetical protein Gorai_019082 [Gossypium raimondii]|uniref:Uncharacterized protein n=1 Tax=Gossypium raimondii TaxID=29730 RepID=A0A7J8PM88_GOSRA|nr:hypothetical protein [Gossypium raimondii]